MPAHPLAHPSAPHPLSTVPLGHICVECLICANACSALLSIGRRPRGPKIGRASATGQEEAGQRRKEDKPLLDPPEIDEEGLIRDTDEVAGWIPGTFPSIFQNETGDPCNFKLAKPDLLTWGPHVLRSRGWAAQAHITFMYWWTNTCQRIKAFGAKKGFANYSPQATGYTAEDIKNMSVPMLPKKMVVVVIWATKGC